MGNCGTLSHSAYCQCYKTGVRNYGRPYLHEVLPPLGSDIKILSEAVLAVLGHYRPTEK